MQSNAEIYFYGKAKVAVSQSCKFILFSFIISTCKNFKGSPCH